MNRVPFSATWFLLEQEGLLAQSCLCNGLTALRHATLGDKKGLFYSAFFELSIGFERVLKLILILDHMGKNKLAAPPSKRIAGYKHDLMRLLKATQGICGNRNLTYLDEFQPESLSLRILEFLDRFADTGGRYSNINQLTGQKHQAHEDPIACWGEIVNRIMEEQATPGERRKVVHTGLRASAALGSIAYCQIRDMDQRSLDITSGFTRNHELDVAAKHAIYALVVLIAALRKVIDSLCDSAREASPNSNSGVADIPDMKEFFQFAWTDKQYVMRKRRWP